MIDLTPLEVRKKKGDFRRTMRGYDPALVDDFLDLVADRLDQLVRENMALSERAARQDHQVAEYRERERALTEALVSAQEMREEIRQQTSREADLVKRSAEQQAEQLRSATEAELAQLRSATEKELTQLRAAAEQEAMRLRTEAEQDAARVRALVEQEAAQLRTAAHQEALQLRSSAERESTELAGTVREEREREEEALRQLRQRQEQFIGSYRSFLERELAELAAVTRGLTLSSESGTRGAAPRTHAPPDPFEPPVSRTLDGPIAAAAADAETAGSEPDPPMPDAVYLQVDTIAAVSAEAELFAPQTFDDVDASVAHLLDDVEAELGAAGVEEEDAFDDLGLLPELQGFVPEPAEPFEPEPFEPEAEGLGDVVARDPVAEAVDEEIASLSGDVDGAVSPWGLFEAETEALTPELYDGIAPDETDDGVPGPIGLTAGTEPAADWRSPTDWAVAGVDALQGGPDVQRPAEPEPEPELAEAGDEETSQLLRNAAAAGYQLPEDDELLLEDAIPDDEAIEQADKEDDGWLPNLLEDDK